MHDNVRVLRQILTDNISIESKHLFVMTMRSIQFHLEVGKRTWSKLSEIHSENDRNPEDSDLTKMVAQLLNLIDSCSYSGKDYWTSPLLLVLLLVVHHPAENNIFWTILGCMSLIISNGLFSKQMFIEICIERIIGFAVFSKAHFMTPHEKRDETDILCTLMKWPDKILIATGHGLYFGNEMNNWRVVKDSI